MHYKTRGASFIAQLARGDGNSAVNETLQETAEMVQWDGEQREPSDCRFGGRSWPVVK